MYLRKGEKYKSLSRICEGIVIEKIRYKYQPKDTPVQSTSLTKENFHMDLLKINIQTKAYELLTGMVDANRKFNKIKDLNTDTNNPETKLISLQIGRQFGLSTAMSEYIAQHHEPYLIVFPSRAQLNNFKNAPNSPSLGNYKTITIDNLRQKEPGSTYFDIVFVENWSLYNMSQQEFITKLYYRYSYIEFSNIVFLG